MNSKDLDQTAPCLLANNAHPDQTATAAKSSLIKVCTVCQQFIKHPL